MRSEKGDDNGTEKRSGERLKVFGNNLERVVTLDTRKIRTLNYDEDEVNNPHPFFSICI